MTPNPAAGHTRSLIPCPWCGNTGTVNGAPCPICRGRRAARPHPASLPGHPVITRAGISPGCGNGLHAPACPGCGCECHAPASSAPGRLPARCQRDHPALWQAAA